MRFKVLPKSIEQLAVINAVDEIYRVQGHTTTLVEMTKDSMTFEMKVNVSPQQRARLFEAKVKEYLPGYDAEIFEANHKYLMKVFRVNK